MKTSLQKHNKFFHNLKLFSHIDILHNRCDVVIRAKKEFLIYSSAIFPGTGKTYGDSIINHYITQAFQGAFMERTVLGLKKKYNVKHPVIMLTSVEMKYAVIEEKLIEGLPTLFVLTCGLGNASSPQDPIEGRADLYKRETERTEKESYESLEEVKKSTINIILVLDAYVPDWLLLSFFIHLTEIKTDLLHALHVKTRFGKLATGTSTDAITIAALQSRKSQTRELVWAGFSTYFGMRLAKFLMFLMSKAIKRAIASNPNEDTNLLPEKNE